MKSEKKSKSRRKVKTVFSNFDKNIFITILLLFIGAAITYGLKWRDYVPCDSINYFVYPENRVITADKAFEFYDETFSSTSWEWDFGDGTEKSRKQSAFHKYDLPGKYIVKLKVNNNCITEFPVEVKPRVKYVDSAKMPSAVIPNNVLQGDLVRFYDKTRFADSWEWSFGESGRVDSKDRNPTYKYNKAGVKTVSLIVNGDAKHVYKHTIVVNPKEKTEDKFIKKHPIADNISKKPHKDPVDQFINDLPVNPPVDDPVEAQKAPAISNLKFEQMLYKVAEKKISQNAFAKYMCDNLYIPVLKNNVTSNFYKLCKDMRGEKIKITTLHLDRDEKGCITGINIKYKKKILPLIWTQDTK